MSIPKGSHMDVLMDCLRGFRQRWVSTSEFHKRISERDVQSRLLPRCCGVMYECNGELKLYKTAGLS